MPFKNNFMYGVATAAYQIEGAAFEEGRGKSIWDDFSHQNGKISRNQNGDIACDHYHRYKEDIKLMSELGVNSYRFSISWTRLLPDGIGKINNDGIRFYNEIIDELLKYKITPVITLFHWDYPSALLKKGGWMNSDSVKWFEEYARVVADSFGNRVKYFITFNEPQCFLSLGYISGEHAPGWKLPLAQTIPMSHNIMLAHGYAVKILRERVPGAKIGYAATSTPAIPYDDTPESLNAARLSYMGTGKNGGNWNWSVTWWSDPVVLGKYPSDALEALGKYLPEGYSDDLKTICQPLDFYGQNIYHGKYVKADKNGVTAVPLAQGFPKTDNDWPITPEALYYGPKFLYERYGLPIIITENGIASEDIVCLDGKVHDTYRVDFYNRYLRELERAYNDGVDISGYFAWSFMDNFEWAKGYDDRFGLVFVDYRTQKRIPKDSFYWYKKIISDNCEKL